MTIPGDGEELFWRKVVEHLAKRLTERQDFSEVVGGEVRAGAVRICPFAADLNDADNLAIEKNRRADHFLNGLHRFTANLDAFEDSGVPRGSKIVFDFRPALASRACGEGRIT